MEQRSAKAASEAAIPFEGMDRKEFIARADRYLEQDPDRAIALALDRLRIHPDDMEARVVLGMGWYRKGETVSALETLMGVAEEVVRWSPVFGILSELCRERGLDDEAAQASRIFVSLNPESPEAIAKLEERLRRETLAGSEPGTEKPEEEAGLPRGADFKTLTLADLYARQGYRELAEALLKEILASDPRNQDALDRLGKIRPRDGNPDEEGVPVVDADLQVPPSLQGFFDRAAGAGWVASGGPARDEEHSERRKDRSAGDPREAILGTLNRWLVSVERMKANA